MKFAFHSIDGCCPECCYNGYKFYLQERKVFGFDESYHWDVYQQKTGYIGKNTKNNGLEVLKRFFNNKKHIFRGNSDYYFYTYCGMVFSASSDFYSVKYPSELIFMGCYSYNDAVRLANKHINERYVDEQISLF